MTGRPLLIRGAELLEGGIADLRLDGGRIAAIGADLPAEGASVLEARGGLLLPGLHEHHLHLAAAAAAMASVRCGPPEVNDAKRLIAALRRSAAQVGPAGWLRGAGYHESVAGLIDRRRLDEAVPDCPMRVQHRSGRLWVFNSLGLERLLASGLPPPPGLERLNGGWTGRLFDEDVWARQALGGVRPSLAGVGRRLARRGVTGVTDMTPSNDAASSAWLAQEGTEGRLPQRVVMAGRLESGGAIAGGMTLGPVKLHLHEAHLPEYASVVSTIRTAHAGGRGVAVHCVTETELVFTLAAIHEAGASADDRIEHASIAPDALVDEIAALGLAVVVQPNFVAERGDAYLSDVAEADRPHLYRLRAFLDAGVRLAGGGDAPFGGLDPWSTMAAAVSRRTASGRPFGESEALTPEEALDLFLADPIELGRTRRVQLGARADLCLLDRPWAVAREDLSTVKVLATLVDGRLVHNGVDQAPAERRLCADAPA